MLTVADPSTMTKNEIPLISPWRITLVPDLISRPLKSRASRFSCRCERPLKSGTLLSASCGLAIGG
jgi:hypothetical protein